MSPRLRMLIGVGIAIAVIVVTLIWPPEVWHL